MLVANEYNTNYPILYSFRRCPYAIRARMALYASGQTCELREVLLKNKPVDMITISPKATVPVLQFLDGEILDESLDIMLWALKRNDPLGWINSNAEDFKESMDLIHENDHTFKIHLDRYKYGKTEEGVDTIFHRRKGEEFLQYLNAKLTDGQYLFGMDPSLGDFAIVPFIRQFANTDIEWFSKTPYGKLQKWLNNLLSSELFGAAMVKYPVWKRGDCPAYFGALDL